MNPEKVDRTTRKQIKTTSKTNAKDTADKSQLVTFNISEDPMTVELILSSHDATEPYQTLTTSSHQELPPTGSIINYCSVISPQDGSAVQAEQNLSSPHLLTPVSSEVL
jgi:hypothetical protein